MKGKIFCFAFLIMVFPSILFSKNLPKFKEDAGLQFPPEYQWMKKHLYKKWLQWEARQSNEPQEIDVKQYTLDLKFFPETYSISGEVTIEAEAKELSLDTIYIDCHDDLIISSLQFNGENKAYTHQEDKITLLFTPSLSPNESFEVKITYQGTFEPNQGEGLIFQEHEGTPVISSLSEPYLAPSWWPCVDNPADKALAEIYLTCPSELRAISNGVLEGEISNGDGTTTSHWSVKNPITTYLIMVAISNYVDITTLPDTFTSEEGNTMPLYYYCYPEHLETAEYHFAQSHDLIALFSDKLGEYPFIDEKHGIIEIPMGSSGMEHQTITSMSSELIGDAEDDYFARVVVGHEVSHQWFGNSVTMKTWNDLWLNEGLATFFQFYYREALGEISAVIEKLGIFGIGLFGDSYQNPVYVKDLTDPFANTGAVYFKGAWVIHMLREMIDDDNLFFSILESYLANHAYGNAETDDLRIAFENGYGVSLDYFFDQWIYTPAWPIYQYEYEITPGSAGKYLIDVSVYQTQDHSVVDITGEAKRDFYIMPLDLTIHFDDGTEQTVTLLNNYRQQRFQLEVDRLPSSIGLDEDKNILKEIKTDPLPDQENLLPRAWGIALPLVGVTPSLVILLGVGVDEDGSINRYSWIIDNKQIIEGPFALTIIEEAGDHQAFLTVEDNQEGAGSSLPISFSLL